MFWLISASLVFLDTFGVFRKFSVIKRWSEQLLKKRVALETSRF